MSKLSKIMKTTIKEAIIVIINCLFLPSNLKTPSIVFLNYQFRLFVYFIQHFREHAYEFFYLKFHSLFFMVMFSTKFLKTCIINAYFRC